MNATTEEIASESFYPTGEEAALNLGRENRDRIQAGLRHAADHAGSRIACIR
jgi:hypothetical protein